MPKYAFKNVMVTSFDVSPSSATAPSEDFKMGYTAIKFDYSHDDRALDNFDFVDFEEPMQMGDRGFTWIEIKRPPKPPSWNNSEEEGINDLHSTEDTIPPMDDAFLF